MSRIACFVAGMTTAGCCYMWTSRRMVGVRNELASIHTADADVPFKPESHILLEKLLGPLCKPASVHGHPTTQLGEHELVAAARRSWNGAVIKASNAVVNVLFSERKKSPQTSTPESAMPASPAPAAPQELPREGVATGENIS